MGRLNLRSPPMGELIRRYHLIPYLPAMEDWGDPMRLPWPAVVPYLTERL